MWQAVVWVLRPMTSSLGCTGCMKVFLYTVTSSRGSWFINLFLSIRHVLRTFVSSMPLITAHKLLLFHDYTDTQCVYQFCVSLCHVPALCVLMPCTSIVCPCAMYQLLCVPVPCTNFVCLCAMYQLCVSLCHIPALCVPVPCTRFVCPRAMYQLCVSLCYVPACWKKAFTTALLNTVSKNLILAAAHQTKMRGPWPMSNAHSSECCIACCQLQ